MKYFGIRENKFYSFELPFRGSIKKNSFLVDSYFVKGKYHAIFMFLGLGVEPQVSLESFYHPAPRRVQKINDVKNNTKLLLVANLGNKS